ncbi:immunoglobulin-like domain-containing protein [Cohnella caldifontis]|uniref:immunoglobulin-like domain-containing protein n=1 Tax=Cohnella caldifontis TaxID=3027471 RepID=UPI0023EAC309|nr:immunoglobulin-like domain-containing protein [Cohnella sp. YIM B05605]
MARWFRLKPALAVSAAAILAIPAWVRPPSASAAPDYLFPAVHYSVGGQPSGIFAGDINGDGKVDLATTTGQILTILFGNGDGTFGSPDNVALRGMATDLTGADLDGDGRSELLVTEDGVDAGGNGGVEVWELDNAGQYQLSGPYVTGKSPVDVEIGSFNGDLYPDAVVANFASNTVSTLLGNGDSTFQSKIDFAYTSPKSLTVSDFDGDGVMSDLFISTDQPNVFAKLLKSKGDGTFQQRMDFVKGPINATALNDFNKDGLQDLASASSDNHELIVEFGSTVPGYLFRDWVKLSTPEPMRSLRAADVNGDGVSDLLAVGSNSGKVLTWLSNGDETFRGAIVSAVQAGPAAIAAGDFNGDGRIDLASANRGGGSVSILLNNTPDADAVTLDEAGLAIGYADGDSASRVTRNLALPPSGTNGSSIVWTSNRPDVLGDDGTVTRPSFVSGNATVRLTAVITKGAAVSSRTFDVVVIKQDPVDEEAVAADAAGMQIGYAAGDSAARVLNDLELPTTGVNGSRIDWRSSREDIVATDGKVTQPAAVTGVRLTAEIRKGSYSATRTFELTVLRAENNSALRFGGTEGTGLSVRVPNVRLDESFTAELWARSETPKWNENGFLLSARRYRGILFHPNQGANTVGFYIPDSSSHATEIPVDDYPSIDITAWHHYALTRSYNGSISSPKSVYKIYLDGRLIQTREVSGYQSYSNVTLLIGKDEVLDTSGLQERYGKADLDEVRVWNRALTDTEVAKLYSHKPTGTETGLVMDLDMEHGVGATVEDLAGQDQNGSLDGTRLLVPGPRLASEEVERFAAEYHALSIDYASGDTADSVTRAVYLPAVGSNGSSVVWTSGSPAVIGADGSVHRPSYSEADAAVTLTARLDNGQETAEKTFVLTVKKLPRTDEDAVAADVGALTIGFAEGDTADSVTQAVYLPTTGGNGTFIDWTSSDPEIVGTSGSVHRPAYGRGDRTVTLTATVRKGGASAERAFTLKVLEEEEVPDPEPEPDPDPDPTPSAPSDSSGSEQKENDKEIAPDPGSFPVYAGERTEWSLKGIVDIIVPKGAVPVDGKMSAAVLPSERVPQSGPLRPLSPVVDFASTSGHRFGAPLQLTFYYDASKLTARHRAAVYYYNEALGKWVYAGGMSGTAGRISVSVNHFTAFGVFEAPASAFSDLGRHWAAAPLDRVIGMNVMLGYPDGTFRPDTPVTRAQFARMLSAALGLDAMANEGTFRFADETDIPAWAKPGVAAVVRAGLIQGDGIGAATRFRPNATVTRAEMAVMAAAALNASPASAAADSLPFKDGDRIPGWARGSVSAAVSAGLLTGYEDGAFRPDRPVTRAEAGVLIGKLLNALYL